MLIKPFMENNYITRNEITLYKSLRHRRVSTKRKEGSRLTSEEYLRMGKKMKNNTILRI